MMHVEVRFSVTLMQDCNSHRQCFSLDCSWHVPSARCAFVGSVHMSVVQEVNSQFDDGESGHPALNHFNVGGS